MKKKYAMWCFSWRLRVPVLAAIFLIVFPVLHGPGAVAGQTDRPGEEPAAGRFDRATGDIRVETVFCPYAGVSVNQSGIPLSVYVANSSGTSILIEYAAPVFSAFGYGDRNGDYIVSGDFMPNVIVPDGEVVELTFSVSVEAGALENTEIRVDAAVAGQRLDNLEAVADTSGLDYARDGFDGIDYGGDNGTLPWSDDWLEIGEDDGAMAGEVQIVPSGFPDPGGALRIGGPVFHAGRGISREVDLQSALRAILSYVWQRDTFPGFQGSDLLVQVTDDDGDSWNTLETIPGGSDFQTNTSSHDITGFIASGTQVRFLTTEDGAGGIGIDDVSIKCLTGAVSHRWIVLSEAVNVIAALYDTRLTSERSDDSLMCIVPGEAVAFNEIHYLNGGSPLAGMPYEEGAVYRLVVQLNSASDWDFDPKEPDRGYFAFDDPACGMGRVFSSNPGIKEFLVTEAAVTDQEADPADIVVGCTRNSVPAVPWGMMSFPWTDPMVDEGKTFEYGSVWFSPALGRWTIDCKDGGKDWEITGQYEADRYYFYEVWFQPDYEWTHGDTADLFLHIDGNPDVMDIRELHLLFEMVEDDTVGPSMGDFSPEVVPEGIAFNITCFIWDPSGVYDDATGSSGQGVHLFWDNDGSLADDSYEIQLSEIGGGYYTTDTPIPPQSAGGEVVYMVFACDDDFDGGDPADRSRSASGLSKVQVVGATYLYDEPGTLIPPAVYPGEDSVTFYISLTNPMTYPMLLYEGSSISFSDGVNTVTTTLSNPAWMFNDPYAIGVPVSFEPVDVPPGFSAPDTMELQIKLVGEDSYGNPYSQAWLASAENRLVIMEPRVRFDSHAIAVSQVHPGMRNVELLRLEVTNMSPDSVYLDSLTVSNHTVGSDPVPASDANFENLYLYRQAGEGTEPAGAGEDELQRGPDGGGSLLLTRPFEAGDSLIGVSSFAGGSATFVTTGGRILPPGRSLFYYVVSDIDSFTACDGDSLDVAIESPGSVHITGEAAVSLDEEPLRSEGRVVVDGCMSHQIAFAGALPDTLYSGDRDRIILSAWLPVNGYAPDVLTGFSVKNYGDAAADGLTAGVRLWADDGDGLFSAASDEMLGEMQWTGDRFEVSGLSIAMFDRRLVHVTADFGEGDVKEFSVRFGIPAGGVEYQSGNDGPVDGDLFRSAAQLLIRREILIVTGEPVPAGIDRPGDTDVMLFAGRFFNNTLFQVQISSMRLTAGDDVFACEPAKEIRLYEDDGDLAFDAGTDYLIDTAVLGSGEVVFGIVDPPLGPGAEQILFAVADLDSYITVDGDTLCLELASQGDLSIAHQAGTSFEFDGAFPVRSGGGRVTDGMLAHQLATSPLGGGVLPAGGTNILIFDCTVPGNGCTADTLTDFAVLNAGTAGGEQIERIVLWGDDGDGLFDQATDDSIAVLAVDTNGTHYASTAISVPLPGAGGKRLFLSATLKGDQAAPGTIIPGIPVMGIGVASGNDGPLDSSVASGDTFTVPPSSIVRFEAHAVPSGVVRPGESGVELLRLEVTNQGFGDVVFDSMIVTNATVGSAAPPENDVDISHMYLYRQGDVSSPAVSSPGSGDAAVTAGTRAASYPTAGETEEYNPVPGPGESRDELSRPFESGDSLVASADPEGGTVRFLLPPGEMLRGSQHVYYYVIADIDSFFACDGDSLDLSILAPDSVFLSGAAGVTFSSVPLVSEGKSVVNGCMGFQCSIGESRPDTVFSGDTDQPVLGLVLPSNGYAADYLTSLAVKNYGDEAVDGVVSSLVLWADDGDAVFESGADTLLGTLHYTGDRFQASGLAHRLSGPTRFFVTAVFGEEFNRELSVGFGVPAGGIGFESGNDGPLDVDLVPESFQLLIRHEYIALDALPVGTDGVVHPGESDIPLLALRIGNSTLGPVTLDSLRVRGDSDLFVCEPSKRFVLYRDAGDPGFDPWNDELVSETVWQGGAALFPALSSVVAVDSSTVFYVITDLDSFKTVDGESLFVRLDSDQDVGFIFGAETKKDFLQIDADFPLASTGGAVTDGMLAHQIVLYPLGDSTVADQRKNLLFLDMLAPPNGCSNDTLVTLTVANYGTPGKDYIERFVLWGDDGDGEFDPASDDSLAEHIPLVNGTGGYAFTGLNVPVPGVNGRRIFVSVDLQEAIKEATTIVPGVPQMGIEVVSGNDGPIDGDVIAESRLIIPVPDRVTFFTSILNNKRVRPGEERVLNVVVGAYNSYQEPKTLQSLTVVNTGEADENEITEITAFSDLDGDGLFDPQKDRVLEIAGFDGFYYRFDHLQMILEPYQNSYLFITYNTVLHGIRDSVGIDMQIPNKTSLGFKEENVVVEGQFELDSPGIDVTDGMIADQIIVSRIDDGMVSPGETDVPCFSLRIPCNGTIDDRLRHLRVRNEGTALPVEDIVYLKLWRETGGNGDTFDPGEDEFVVFFASFGSYWSNLTPMDESLPNGGGVFHVTADIVAGAVDGRTLRLELPAGGVSVDSGNDGPIDEAVVSPAVIEITTDPLIVRSIEAPQFVTSDQIFDVTMTVYNAGDSLLFSIAPDSFTSAGSGSVLLLSGPAPPSADIPGSGETVFTWSFRAVTPGAVVLRGRAVGGGEVSQFAVSDTVTVQAPPAFLSVTLEDLSPVSLNRGAGDAAVFEIVCDYASSCVRCAGVELVSVSLLFTGGSGVPLAVGDVASRIHFEDESMLLASIETGDLEDSLVTITPEPPVLLVPGDSKTFRFSLDIDVSAPAQDFRIVVQDAGRVVLVDRNTSETVSFAGTPLPWATNSVVLNDPAMALVVRMNRILPERLNRGQEGVDAFELVLENDGGSSGADISVSEIIVGSYDGAGDSVETGELFRHFRVTDGGMNTYFETETFSGSASVLCNFQPAITVSPQIPVSLHAIVDCLSEPVAGSFFLALRDSLDMTARDGNSGQRVEVRPDAGSGEVFPMQTGPAEFFDPLGAAVAAGTRLLPEHVTVGSANVATLGVVMLHPGEPGESWAKCTGIHLRVLDQAGNGLIPYGRLDAVHARSNSGTLSTLFVNATHTPDLTLLFSEPMLIAPGGRDTVTVFLDFDQGAPSGYIQVHIGPQGLDIEDATDGLPLASVDGDFPLTSGVAQIILPAENVVFEAEPLMPQNVTGSEVARVFNLHIARDDGTGSASVRVGGLAIDVLDGGDNPVDPSRIVSDLFVFVDDAPLPATFETIDDRIVIVMSGDVVIEDGQSVDLAVEIELAERTDIEIFSMQIGGASDVVCTDMLSGDPTGIEPAPGSSFPYNSGRAAFLQPDIRKAFSNYPNPFVASSEETRITYFLPAEGAVTVRVYTITGRLVRTLLAGGRCSAGLHQDLTWDGRNGKGEPVLNGVYYLFLTMNVNGTEHTMKRKVAVVR